MAKDVSTTRVARARYAATCHGKEVSKLRNEMVREKSVAAGKTSGKGT